MMPTTPIGPIAWVCLLLGVFGCVPAVNRRLSLVLFEGSTRRYVAFTTAMSFGLSVAYVHAYLGGGPRIIDATSYLLQAKIFATGKFTFEAPGALHSFAGRFLVTTPDGNLAVLFPPGFAVVLALGVALGAPLLVNPLVGALTAFLTYRLGAQWFSERSARVAGLLSVMCACLRYHSADTMSHAWTATLVLGVLLFATAARRRVGWSALSAGACAGWLFATRPVTGALFGCTGLWLVCMAPGFGVKGKRALVYLLGAAPGLILWWSYQWVTTGSAWTTSQTAYYTQSDFPFGCFRLGLGATIGCRFEHGNFLDTYQPHGFGIVDAAHVTLRRLWQHQRDITNVPWLALCATWPLRVGFEARARARTLGALVLTHVLGYAFFYFDGNYPGGGARLFVDVMPLEHVLLGVAFTQLNVARFVPGVCCLGFALWGAAQHEALAKREGGKPMFEPRVIHDAQVSNALVFVSTDHGFNLGYEPSSDHRGLRVARLRNDGFDFATWLAMDKPPAFAYHFEPNATGPTRVFLESFQPANSLTFAGRSFWPLRTTGGATIPVHNPDGLRLLPRPEHTLEAQVELPISKDDHYQLQVQLDSPSPTTLDVSGWSRDTERRSDNTTVLTYGPRFLYAGKTALALRSDSEMTVLKVMMVPSGQPLRSP